ncbi:MAG: ROK family protein [Erysipelotrichaceae bacterium]|nr:ROK family protein [Erysipelotrichaceae bacterium]
MDEFLRDINTALFKEWILEQKQDYYQLHLDEKHDDVIIIESENSYGQVIFNSMDIIELCVTNLITQKNEFYLHFQMQNLKHAIDLFHEMEESIHKLINRPKVKILLSCSGGLTTSYFAEKLQEASDLLNLDYQISATSYNNLFDKGKNYDVILLAPQISYMLVKVQEILKDKIVLNIPAQYFAKYDITNTFLMIDKARKENKEQLIEEKHIPLAISTHTHDKILIISIVRNSHRIHVDYRLYNEDNEIMFDNHIIKFRFSIADLYDIIDTVLLQHSFNTIGISIPGIINDGYITSASVTGLIDCNLIQLLSSRYQHMHIVIDNDVNTAAVGYYASQKTYQNMVFLFQPMNFHSGAGIIIDGQLIKGKNHLAGEIQYLPMNLSDDRFNLAKTPEGALELVAQTLVSMIAIISPEAICFCCGLIPHVEELKEEMSKYIPNDYICDIIRIEDIHEYTLLGQLILTINEIS